MNSFLTAKVFRLPINSYEDVISTDMDLILHRGYYEENVFKFAPQGSLFKEVYNRKLLGKPRFHDYDGLEDVLERVKDGKAMYFTGTDAMMIRADYPCAMTDNKKIRLGKLLPLLPLLQCSQCLLQSPRQSLNPINKGQSISQAFQFSLKFAQGIWHGNTYIGRVCHR